MNRKDYGSPEDAPATVLAADGVTLLYRFRVDAVIYAPSTPAAQSRLNSAAVFLDRAALHTTDTEQETAP